ncbi:hypothetical protein [Sphingomonas sp.]|uniref:hypothetical protein n=1 Tax=Sphingomonas sp. TaxID=28214 RepID=UPI00286B74C2|nr:hypothetical protein [Sphingomonas sp.]
MSQRPIALLAALILSACAKPTETNGSNNTAAPAETVVTPLTPPAPGTPGGLPDDRTPLEEPQGLIDPKSTEAAGQIVQSYGALIEQKRFAEAAKLWGDAAMAAAFVDPYKAASELHVQVGKPGDSEGAAGSIYVRVPVVLYGSMASGAFSLSGTATLRRVNDVDGSTEAQRRWHITQIEVASAG